MSSAFTISVGLSAAALVLTATVAAQHHGHAHRHPAAAKMKNPVGADAASIAAGRELYETHCADCHGSAGKGDGFEGEGLDEKPSDLTDAAWEHGSTDGEIFTVVRDGAGPKSDMKGFGKKMSEREIWHVVNFVRTLNTRK